MSRRLYIHVGPRKTATSTIQQTLASQENSTVFYPRTGQGLGGAGQVHGHHGLVLGFFGGNEDRDVLMDSLAAECRQTERDILLSAEILVAHGKFLLSHGRLQDSIEKDRSAIEIDPESRDAHYEFARGLEQKVDFKSAALEGERALALPELDTSDAQIHYLLAKLYRKLNQPALAKTHLEEFLAARQTTLK